MWVGCEGPPVTGSKHSRSGAAAVLVLTLLAIGFLFLSPGPAQAQVFTDVAGDEYFAAALQALSEQGIVQGRADGSFGPQDPVTRAQLAALLTRVLGLPPSANIPFVDLTSLHWSYGQVAALYWAGLVSGDGRNRFLPDEPVSRQQAATLIVSSLAYRLAQEPAPGVTLSGPFRPHRPLAGRVPRPARDRSRACPRRRRRLPAGRDGGFHGRDGSIPGLSLTRAQMVVLLHRAFYQPLTPKGDYPQEVPVEWYARQSSGSEGLLVQMLEARLTALSYPCGPEDGVYDYRTKDAVMAFEKVERLRRDGIADQEVWQRLFSTGTPSPRLDRPGTGPRSTSSARSSS